MTGLHRAAARGRERAAEERPHSGAFQHPILALQRRAGNRATATLMRVGGFSDALPGSGNAGGSTTTDPVTANSVRRIPVTGIAGAATDRAIVYLPAVMPAGGGAIDVLLHLHGHPAGGPGGYLGGKKDTDVTDPGDKKESRPSPEADDIDEYRIGAQLAAAGRPMVAILPQGVGKSDFGAGEARAFDADSYIRSTFSRLGALGAWTAKDAPTPGPVVLSGHSGADNPMSRMLSSSLGPKNLGALFLFDTMYPGAGFVEKIWVYVKGRLDGELAALEAIREGSTEQDADAAGSSDGPRPASSAAVLEPMLDYVLRQGFRLFNVHGGSTYKPQSDQLAKAIDGWFAQPRVGRVVGGADSPLRDAWRGNFEIFRSADRAKGVHMRILRYGDHLKKAVDLLPQRMAVDAPALDVTVSRAPAPNPADAKPADGQPEKTPEELIADASNRIHTTLLAAAAPFIGTADAADIPGMLTMQIISGAKDPRKKLKADNRMRPLYDALWDQKVIDDLRTVDDPAADTTAKKKPKKAEDRRRAILTGLLSGLLPSSAAGAAVAAPGKPLDKAAEMATEKSLVSKTLLDLTTDKSWENVRIAVVVKFGGLVDGPRLAIERANTYYGSLVPAKFLNYNGFTVVHPHLQAALTKAETYLKPKLASLPKEEVDGIDAAVKKMWSTVIRPNQNARHKLSDHSFGWAIDIDAAKNPNIGKGAGLAAVAAVAGKNPRATKTAGLSADKVQTSATELRQLSKDYVTAMSTDTTVAAVLLRLANEGRTAAKLPALESGAGATLVTAVKTAKAADRATAVQNAVWPEGKDLPPVVSGKGKSKKVKKAAAPAQLQESIATIETVGTAYRTSFGKKGARVAAKTEGSAGSVAAHGFLSLPPALVAALSGSDAGGLIWLGTANQDYMHFELAKEPALFDASAGATKPADATGSE
ncbi:hypothetical protein ACVBEQ_04605 [Nakamurella sp. GG22]